MSLLETTMKKLEEFSPTLELQANQGHALLYSADVMWNAKSLGYLGHSPPDRTIAERFFARFLYLYS